MPLDMALAKGLFKHTEPGVTGIGQGKPKPLQNGSKKVICLSCIEIFVWFCVPIE